MRQRTRRVTGRRMRSACESAKRIQSELRSAKRIQSACAGGAQNRAGDRSNGSTRDRAWDPLMVGDERMNEGDERLGTADRASAGIQTSKRQPADGDSTWHHAAWARLLAIEPAEKLHPALARRHAADARGNIMALRRRPAFRQHDRSGYPHYAVAVRSREGDSERCHRARCGNRLRVLRKDRSGSRTSSWCGEIDIRAVRYESSLFLYW